MASARRSRWTGGDIGTVLFSKTSFYKSQPLQFPNTWGGRGLSHKPDYHKTPPPPPSLPWHHAIFSNKLGQNLSPQFPLCLGIISQTEYHKSPPSPLTMMPCYISKRSLTKVNLLSFPQHLADGGLSHNPDYHRTAPPLLRPPYNDTVLYFKTIFEKKVNLLNSPNHGGGYLTNRITTKLHPHFPSPLTMTPCYILKWSLTKVNLLNSPDTWGGGLLHKQDYHKTSPPPYNDVVLYSKTNFSKSQHPRFPQHLGGYLTNRVTTKLHLHFPLPPYNDTVVYFKTIFHRSRPPQFHKHFGVGAISQTRLPRNSGGGRTRLPKFKFSAKFPIGLHVILQIQIKKNRKWLLYYVKKYFNRKSVEVQRWTPLEIMLNGFCLKIIR